MYNINKCRNIYSKVVSGLLSKAKIAQHGLAESAPQDKVHSVERLQQLMCGSRVSQFGAMEEGFEDIIRKFRSYFL